MSTGARILIRLLIGIIAGLITASSLGIPAGSYLGYAAVSTVVFLVLAIVAVVLFTAIHGEKAGEAAGMTLLTPVAVVTAYNWGFTFYQMAVLTTVGCIVGLVALLIFPTNRG